jgi:hypothetical protein
MPTCRSCSWCAAASRISAVPLCIDVDSRASVLVLTRVRRNNS